MRVILIFLLIIGFASCKQNSTGWQTLDFGVFKLKAPQGWNIVKEKGIDSYVGGLANQKDSLWFDYGWYSANNTGDGEHYHRIAKDTVNGLPATITIPDTPGKGHISMYIKLKGQDRFIIWGAGITSTDTILKIFKSIVFKDSDTLNNPSLTMAKFTSRILYDGEELFYRYCASCHTINKELLGPPLGEVVMKRSTDWIYLFLADRQKVLNDSSYKSSGRKYEVSCNNFPELSKQDVELIVGYISDYSN